jgi:hypothetical protein
MASNTGANGGLLGPTRLAPSQMLAVWRECGRSPRPSSPRCGRATRRRRRYDYPGAPRAPVGPRGLQHPCVGRCTLCRCYSGGLLCSTTWRRGPSFVGRLSRLGPSERRCPSSSWLRGSSA